MRPPAEQHSGELLRKLSAALSQYTFFYGLQYTNAIFAITFTNMAPVLTFLIAVLLRSKSVKLLGGKSFSIDGSAVHQILGIPLGGKKVPTKSSSHSKSIVLKDTSGSRQATKIDDLIATVNQNDSGVFVMQLLLSYRGKTHFHFKQEHAKPIRESLTYYLCTHEDNEIVLLDIKNIACQHGIFLENNVQGRKRYF
ncbi:WAT1-related protein At5g07050-like isoform X5 [Panicum virgatum]|uniref:WAT1-related protein At5g07050-like isoform X2 n=1 Tax=Panicum virgatum TaxID=38727 RepID=UPI0019D68AE2|nr:WAT1-related protein At5g07050-like isoform X2 [Panicum virgatum]XP_039790117.1 WAT1-related protein At5g07050-like isoform X5 [Panicum virgatum]